MFLLILSVYSLNNLSGISNPFLNENVSLSLYSCNNVLNLSTVWGNNQGWLMENKLFRMAFKKAWLPHRTDAYKSSIGSIVYNSTEFLRRWL